MTAGSSQESVGKKANHGGVDIEVWGSLPFGLQVQGLAQESPGIRVSR
jgi:hypothetical protein